MAILLTAVGSALAKENKIDVNVDNIRTVESHVQMDRYQKVAGGINKWVHNLTPVDIDNQTTIAMNRDTLYSFVVVDMKKPVTVTIPENNGRYFSLEVIDEDNYAYAVYTQPGKYSLSEKDVGTRYAVLAFRIFMNPNDAKDLATANSIQKQLKVEAGKMSNL